MLKKFCGLEEITPAIYQTCWERYGGNLSTHPGVLAWQEQELRIHTRYFGRTDAQGNVTAAISVWDNRHIAGDSKTAHLTRDCKFPISRDELILPVRNGTRLVLPWKCRILSDLHREHLLNGTWRINAGRAICLARDINAFNRKFRKNRERELRTFLEQGGEIRDVGTFSPSELTDIYAELFYRRWGVPLAGLEEHKAYLSTFSRHLWGQVLFMKGEPCAYHLVMRAESPQWINYDYICTGLDLTLKHLSPGTVLTWVNINRATQECQQSGKAMRYSFGKPTADYKKMWCQQYALGRVLMY
ncbi:GNAT family N-acetyltransferase [Entomohabitans teleogrylli]|uniref:GNAT family N-acetyltransferase n=1 Tax=Entomohabitans teleogrylli TaxID=1384589 RepID=UPI00073D82DB|nr:GNAT family N-acetyltransferase [Entomohabitans teleogrylli]